MMNIKKTLTEFQEWFSGTFNTRKRKGVFAAAAVAAILGISGIYLTISSQFYSYDDELGLTGETEQVIIENEESKFSNTISEGTIQKGQSLYGILTGEGLTPAQVHEITTQLKGSFSIRNFRPGKSYLIEKDPSGNFLCFTYQQSPSNILHVQKNPETQVFNIWQETFEYRNRVSALTGTISSNLAAELQQHNRYGLITQLQKLFAFQINFKRDIQPGTAYNILFEEKWLEGEFIGTGNILAAEIFIDNTPTTAYRYTDSGGNTGYYDEKGKSVISSFFVNPCNYSRISSRFGYRVHPILRRRHFHGGVDFAAPRGTPVYAVADGKIVFRGRKGAAGNMVTISHTNGYHTKYLHLSRFSANARYGSRVKQGQVIGYVGSTGRSTGPHLDFRVVHHGKLKNPLVALKSACKTKALPKTEMENFLARISNFRMQLENGNILVAGLAKHPAGNASALN